MPALERETSRDPEPGARHQHSFSFSDSINGRSSVPMWDSSDPDRCPAPLPLPPGHGSPTTKANTSAGIAAAAKQIVERARESAPISSYTSNLNKDSAGLPERSLVKGAHHKRMQSLQPGSVKDLRSYLDNNRSPERSPERPSSRGTFMPYNRMSSIEDLSPTPDRSSTPTPAERQPLKESRSSARPPTRGMFGENTPPSATMLALQTMQVPDPPLNDITNGNGPSTPGGTRMHTTYDFSSQLLNLTTIATNLQKEMTQLSRRSKDNATDLLTLKEATHTRDEDIRKTLRDLANSVGPQGLLPPPPPLTGARSTSNYSAPQFLDSKAFSSPPSATKTSFNLPRAASAHSFLEERCGSPSPYSVEGAASVAMLEKIIREMVTKDGQERLLGTLSELLEKSREENVEAAKKVEQLSEFIREKSESQALVRVPNGNGPPKLELNFDSHKDSSKSGVRSDDITSSEELMKALQRIRDSIAHSGGTTAEVKGLVRDLRGEVLGMGRELGKKLDQVSQNSLDNSLDRSINDGKDAEQLEEIQRVVEEGMSELKQHLSTVLKERAEQDDDSFKQLATARSGPNGDEMLAVVKHALAEHSNTVEKREPEVENIDRLDRDGILDAVKDGLKDFEPNIELQQFGLERDEILNVLKEGLDDYQKNRPEPSTATIDKGEIYEVMQEALKDFQAPYPAEQLAQLKEELISNVRNALEETDRALPTGPAMDHATIEAAVFEAVKHGFANHGPSAPREIEISRDDLFDAVKSSLDGSAIPFGGFGEQVLSQLRELIDGMRVEFKQYSAANGRDTEQVLDAVKDGLESLRAEIESYVDKAQDVTGKDEIVDTVKGGLEQLRQDVQSYCSEGPAHDGGRAEMLEYIKAEFEQLHEAVTNNGSSREVEESNAGQTTAVIIALKEGLDDLKAHIEGHNDDMTSNEELNEAIKEEFEQLKGAILNAHASDKSELIETIQDSLGVLHSKFNGSDLTTSSGGLSEDIMRSIREELATLKESIHAIVSEVDKDAVVAGVQQALDDLRTQLTADQDDASEEALGAIKEELERFKESFNSSLVLGASGSSTESTETLQAIQSVLEEVKEATAKTGGNGMTDEQLEAFRGEFENLRNSIATSVVHGGSNEEVLDAMRLGLDDLRSHLERKLDNPESVMSHQSQVLDALNEGLESLRTDIVKTLDKPLDMTVNYEILDTLKDGLAGLRSEMDKLTSRDGRPITPQGGEIVLAEGAAIGATRELPTEGEAEDIPPAPETIKRADLEKMEVLLAQLQIKVEAMDHTLQDMPMHHHSSSAAEPADGTAMKEDLSKLEAMIKEVQDNVITLAAREERVAPEYAARKEDTDAIETLLRNTKDRLDELAVPDLTGTASKDHLDEVQTAVRLANDALESLADKIENSTASKADVAVVEVLASDIKTLMEELKEKQAAAPAEEDAPEPMTKSDLDVLGVLCTEIKTRVNEMVIPDADDMPSKADVEQLQGLIADFRDSHDKMKESYETDIAVTAKAFDDRKQEHEDTVILLSEVKSLMGDVKSELLDKLGESDSGLNTLGETLKGIEDRSNNDSVIAEVKDVMEKVKEEFERAHESLGAIKVDHAQTAESALEKQSEHKSAVVAELGEKLDGLFDGLMSKYDDAQLAAEEKAKAMEEKAAEQAELMASTKTMADDLKLSIDTLGSTLTSFMGDLPATVEKMAEDNKTVFNQVAETYAKVEEATEGFKGEHAATREEVARVLAAVDVVQSDMADHNPRFMVTLEEVRALINQHYEHSQKASGVAAEHAQAVKDLQDVLKAGFEDSKAQAQAHQDGLRSHHEELKTALPALMPPAIEAPTPDKYDDTSVQEKLDRLMGHVEEAATHSTQLERLDQIHEKVMATAAEVSAFVSAQNKQISDDHESKEKEAEEVALLLERRLERKDQLEADITVLNEEKESLANAVATIKAEKEALEAQKARVNADVKSLETALHIRRDELHEMDNKAAMIERRMLEGVMNQSRMLLLAKSSKPASKKTKPQGRDLRVPSNASAMSAQTVTSSVPALKAGHALAMKARPGIQRNGAMANTPERRIMSLNQINHNVPTGAAAFTTEKPSLVSNGLNSMKRSHSVKTNAYVRKTSWPAKRNFSLKSHNKENETLSEEDEDDLESRPRTREGEEFGSEVGTERRQSYLSGTDGSMTYATGSYRDGETPGTDDGRRESEMTFDTGSYLTGSYLTGSEIDRRTSLGSSANGVVGTHSGVSQEAEPAVGAEREDSEEEREEREAQDQLAPLQLEAPPSPESKKNGRVYAPPSDSGLGSDMPTVGMLSGGEEYFK